jgi:dTDP-4-dehydrorhamnose reductase
LNPRHFVVRTAWVYHEEGANFPRTMLRLAAGPNPIRVVADQVGSPTYAPHLAAAIARLVATGAFGTYHMAGSGQASWHELTCALFERLGIDRPVEAVTTEAFPRPAERPRYSVLTTLQEPRIELPPWREGLAAFCAKVPRTA